MRSRRCLTALGCVWDVSRLFELARIPQPLKTGSPVDAVPVSQDSTKRMRGWRKPKITGLLGSTEGDCSISGLVCGAGGQASHCGALARAEHKGNSVLQLPCGGASEGNPFSAGSGMEDLRGDLLTAHLLNARSLALWVFYVQFKEILHLRRSLLVVLRSSWFKNTKMPLLPVLAGLEATRDWTVTATRYLWTNRRTWWFLTYSSWWNIPS